MTDKELIKQEIERRINNLWHLLPEGEKVLQDNFTKDDANNLGKYTALESLLRFIDSLPEESASEDLEEEFHSWMREYSDDNGFFNPLELAKHFAEWQKEKHNKQYGFLNLKDCKDAYNEWKSTQENPSAALAWIRACEWQKQQMKETLQTEYEKGRSDKQQEMMKDAQDAIVVVGSDKKLYAVPILIKLDEEIRNKKKVKLVIIDINEQD